MSSWIAEKAEAVISPCISDLSINIGWSLPFLKKNLKIHPKETINLLAFQTSIGVIHSFEYHAVQCEYSTRPRFELHGVGQWKA